MNNLRGILVVGETEGGKLNPITHELLGGARELVKIIEEEASLLLMGEELAPVAQEGISFGADKIFIVESPLYRDYNPDSYAHLICGVCKKANPRLCLMGHTDLGREAAPRVSARLGAGICMDCVELRVDSSKQSFVQTRPVFGGKAMAEITSLPGNIQIDTVRRKSMSPISPSVDRKGEIVDLTNEIDPPMIRAKLVNQRRQESEGIDLEKAKVIVAGGGGIGNREGFERIKELAQLLGGAVGTTRVPVDEGWVPHSLEIGQTGKIVSPDLYVAVGISGATQHVTGILGSKYIIAINKDPDANIFKVSNLGVAADYKEVLPRVIESLKTLIQ
ncbi:MAG: electron transfer flavoprotein subunit alpha [Deltaproteobacteria bacterium CG_4_8_14_3_um_filter_45_9]|nr:MAG: electron transfer flavoprotein subunit alpha [Deltaproteobacteria bacterium CG03_land_8_20_14_0_80_45_14]PIX23825.1 MAG: electron transfer flavoprotein subunit alpha [Deltaproteobacteria bacterium CG_4_8_14_3_um_filter_45_9]